MMAHNRLRVSAGLMTIPLQFWAIFALVAAMLVVTVGCTPEDARTVARTAAGVELTDTQAAAVSAHYTRPTATLASTHTVTPEQARAIAWTVAWAEAQKTAPAPVSYADMIRARWAGTGHGEKAVKVATCESGLNPAAQNRNSTAFGLFQFLNATWISTGIAKTRDAFLQIEAAFRLWKARGWQPWLCA